MPSKIVIGKEPWLSMALEDWKLAEPLTVLIPFEIKLDHNYLFDFPNLDAFSPSEVTGFVAWGPEFLNFQRLELVGELKKRGFKLPPLIHPSAQISVTAKIQENVWIHALTCIGPNTLIEFNSCVSTGVKIGSNVIIQKSTWLDKNVIVEHCAEIGANSFLGNRVEVSNNVIVGRQVRIEEPVRLLKDQPDKTFKIRASQLTGQIIKL